MKRIRSLDGIRGIAIILVLIDHYFKWQLASTSEIAFRVSSLVWSGVDLFFVLSGFLIAGILLDNRNTSNFYKIFYLRRVCRIFPLYFAVLAAFVCMKAGPLFTDQSFHWLFENPLPVWSYSSFTQNILMGRHGNYGPNWLGITWSLAVEEHFYLIIPVLIYYLSRRNLAAIFVVAILAAPLLRALSPGFHANVYTPWRSDSLLSGALLAILVRWHPFITAARQYRQLLFVTFVALLAGVVVMTFREPAFGAFNHFWFAGLFSTLILIAFMGEEPLIGAVLKNPVLVWFGKLSYGIYMVHQIISGLVYGYFRHGPPQMNSIGDAWIPLVSLLLSLALAMLSFRFFEGPILRFGHRFQYLPKHK